MARIGGVRTILLTSVFAKISHLCYARQGHRRRTSAVLIAAGGFLTRSRPFVPHNSRNIVVLVIATLTRQPAHLLEIYNQHQELSNSLEIHLIVNNISILILVLVRN